MNNRYYERFNDLATECDMLENYIKNNDVMMSKYQLNQLKNRLALKQIKRDIAYNHVPWEDEPYPRGKNSFPREENTSPIFIFFSALLFLFSLFLFIVLMVISYYCI